MEVYNASQSQATQNNQVEAMAQDGCDIICVNLVDRIQMLYLWDRDRERGKKKPKISHSTFDRKINLIYFVPFAQ